MKKKTRLWVKKCPPFRTIKVNCLGKKKVQGALFWLAGRCSAGQNLGMPRGSLSLRPLSIIAQPTLTTHQDGHHTPPPIIYLLQNTSQREQPEKLTLSLNLKLHPRINLLFFYYKLHCNRKWLSRPKTFTTFRGVVDQRCHTELLDWQRMVLWSFISASDAKKKQKWFDALAVKVFSLCVCVCVCWCQ